MTGPAVRRLTVGAPLPAPATEPPPPPIPPKGGRRASVERFGVLQVKPGDQVLIMLRERQAEGVCSAIAADLQAMHPGVSFAVLDEVAGAVVLQAPQLSVQVTP